MTTIDTDTATETVSPTVELSPDESWAHFDGVARARLGISGEDSLRRLDSGEYDAVVDDPVDHSPIVYLAALSRYVR
jgi:hypothetical protein